MVNKTAPTEDDAQAFFAALEPATRRDDALALSALMRRATRVDPVLWVGGIIGFGTHHYVYESGREGDTAAVGFAPRRRALVIYGLFQHPRGEDVARLVRELGRHTLGKGCLYIASLADIDSGTLEAAVAIAYARRAAD